MKRGAGEKVKEKMRFAFQSDVPISCLISTSNSNPPSVAPHHRWTSEENEEKIFYEKRISKLR